MVLNVLPDRSREKKNALLTGSSYSEKETYLSQLIPSLSLFFSLSVREAKKIWSRLKRLKQRMEKLKKLKPRP